MLTKRLACLAFFALAVIPWPAAAADWEYPPYLKFDAGPAWISGTGVKDLFGSVPPGTKVDFGIGGRLALGLGYELTDWFAAEFETGVMVSPIRRITGAVDVDATVFTVPLMVNGIFQVPTGTRLTPYAGVGIGGASSTLDVGLRYRNTRFSGSASDAVFAFQGFAGLRCALTDQAALGLEYRFLRSEGPSYDIDWGWYANLHSDHVRFEAMEIHMVSIRLDVRF